MRTAMLIAICSVAVGLIIPGAATASSGPDDAFRGRWTSVDHDGSNQKLKVWPLSETGRHPVRLYDDAATGACGGVPARFKGSGRVDGDSLTARGRLRCLPGGDPFGGRITIGFVYDAGTDTLTDDSGVVWSRA